MKWNEISVAEESFSDQFSSDGIVVRDALIKSESVTPFEVYLCLKEAFGLPNSEMFDEDKSQWMYALQTTDAYFEVYDWKQFSWSIAVYVKDKDYDAYEVGSKFLKLVEHKAKSKKAQIKDRAKKPDGLVIENPYMIYRDTGDSVLNLARELSQKTGFDGDSINFNHYRQSEDLCRSSFLMYLSSVEAFMNLVYELYLKSDLREKRIYDRISREQIDLKIKLAPLYCECFSGDALSADNEVFKKYHSLVNLRNDFVHANVTKPMMTPIIQEDGFEFLINSDSTTSIGIPSSFNDFDIGHIELVKDITQNLVDYVIQTMTPRYRREIVQVLEHSHIQVEYENGQMYVI
ncbi:hypothetical protein AB4622_20120 [Vibrio splendidus]